MGGRTVWSCGVPPDSAADAPAGGIVDCSCGVPPVSPSDAPAGGIVTVRTGVPPVRTSDPAAGVMDGRRTIAPLPDCAAAAIVQSHSYAPRALTTLEATVRSRPVDESFHWENSDVQPAPAVVPECVVGPAVMSLNGEAVEATPALAFAAITTAPKVTGVIEGEDCEALDPGAAPIEVTSRVSSTPEYSCTHHTKALAEVAGVSVIWVIPAPTLWAVQIANAAEPAVDSATRDTNVAVPPVAEIPDSVPEPERMEQHTTIAFPAVGVIATFWEETVVAPVFPVRAAPTLAMAMSG